MKPMYIILIAAGLYFMTMKKPAVVVAPVDPGITDAQMRANLINWYTGSDAVRFDDIINGISPNEVATIYTYVFGYLLQGIKPPVGSLFYNTIEGLISRYGLLLN